MAAAVLSVSGHGKRDGLGILPRELPYQPHQQVMQHWAAGDLNGRIPMALQGEQAGFQQYRKTFEDLLQERIQGIPRSGWNGDLPYQGRNGLGQGNGPVGLLLDALEFRRRGRQVSLAHGCNFQEATYAGKGLSQIMHYRMDQRPPGRLLERSLLACRKPG